VRVGILPVLAAAPDSPALAEMADGVRLAAAAAAVSFKFTFSKGHMATYELDPFT
jgi:hypothetical protein